MGSLVLFYPQRIFDAETHSRVYKRVVMQRFYLDEFVCVFTIPLDTHAKQDYIHCIIPSS